jgi:hypothetical protein
MWDGQLEHGESGTERTKAQISDQLTNDKVLKSMNKELLKSFTR